MAFNKPPEKHPSARRPPLSNSVKIGSYPAHKQFLVRVSGDIAEQLGFTPGKRVAFFNGDGKDAGWVALTATEHPDSVVVQTGPAAKAPYIYLSRSRVPGADKLPTGTTDAEFHIENGALFVRIPQVEQRPANPFHRKRGTAPRNRPNGLATEVRA